MICPTPVNILLDTYAAEDHPERSWLRYCVLMAASEDAQARCYELEALAAAADPYKTESECQRRAEVYRGHAESARTTGREWRRMAEEERSRAAAVAEARP